MAAKIIAGIVQVRKKIPQTEQKSVIIMEITKTVIYLTVFGFICWVGWSGGSATTTLYYGMLKIYPKEW